MHSSDAGTVHIIGAGLAGLAAAVRLGQSRRTVAVHEAPAQAGGLCRSYYDQATDMLIDNGIHLLLSGNHAALSFAETISYSSASCVGTSGRRAVISGSSSTTRMGGMGDPVRNVLDPAESSLNSRGLVSGCQIGWPA